MTKVEIINMVANHYNENNRSIGNGGCWYARDGKMCAVGMCMTDEAIYWFGSFGGDINELSNKLLIQESKSLDTIFKDEYKGHSLDFWKELQDLHDDSFLWDECGLTLEGWDKANRLIERYTNK